MLNPNKVPEDLRDLIPLAEKWGDYDEAARNRKVERATKQERAALVRAVEPKARAIDDWLNSFGEEDPDDEAAAFMYLTFAATAAGQIK